MSLLETLCALELELHRSDTRSNRQRLEQLLHPSFREFGRSGATYSRADILAEFEGVARAYDVSATDFRVVELTPGSALLTYVSAHRLADGTLERFTHRCSVWVHVAGNWQMIFHQGTPAEAAVV